MPPRYLLLACLAAAPPACGPSRRAPAAPAPGVVWGVTIDDVWNTAPTVDALARLPRRPTARIVLDLGPSPLDYAGPVAAVRRVADVMALLVDSSGLAEVSPADYAARARAFLDVLGPDVDVWEVGNEVNGEWTGDAAAVAAKVAGALAAVKAHGGRSALTLYYNEGCTAGAPDREVFRWADEHLSPALRAQLDDVWLSYYEEDCPGSIPDWPAAFARLGALFPNAVLGIGECGGRDGARGADVLERCYGIRPPHPRFVGGWFWWQFSEDMVPASKPLWSVLADLQRAPGQPPPRLPASRARAREEDDRPGR